jgi:hypothetical protein
MPPITVNWSLWVLVTLIGAQGINAQDAMYISDTDCTFRYALNPYYFTFYYCSQGSSNQLAHTWSICLSQCCPSMPQTYDYPSFNALSICQENNSHPAAPVLVIIIAVVASVCLLVTVCLLCVWCRSLKPRHKIVNDTEVSEVEWQEEEEFNNGGETIKWSVNAREENTLADENVACSICLDEGTLAELFCRHRYHTACIGAWLAKSNYCPYCRMSNIRGIKIYCSNCRWRYFVATINLISQHARELPILCETCQRKTQEEVDMAGIEDSSLIIQLEESH